MTKKYRIREFNYYGTCWWVAEIKKLFGWDSCFYGYGGDIYERYASRQDAFKAIEKHKLGITETILEIE